MKRSLFQRFLAGAVTLAMLITLIPMESLQAAGKEARTKEYEPADSAVAITAESQDTITVQKQTKEPEEFEEKDGLLTTENVHFTIDRAEQQSCMIQVTNTSKQVQQFYLQAANSYEDVSLAVIENGSKSSPAIINPGETLEVKLAVYAQDAVSGQYSVPVTAYLFRDEAYVTDFKKSITLECALPELNLTWKRISEDRNTLRQKYQVTNNGSTVADLTIGASESLAAYLSFSPAVSHQQLKQGESLELTVWPDLAKMKADGKRSLNGYLAAESGGKTSQCAALFDTKGQEISLIEMGQLALTQAKHPFSKYEIVGGSVSPQSKKGTSYAAAGSLNEFYDSEQSVRIKSGMQLDLGVGKQLNAAFTIEVFVVGQTPGNLTPVMELTADGTLHVVYQTVVTEAEYQTLLSRMQGASPGGASSGGQRLVEITLDINGMADCIGTDASALGVLGTVYDLCRAMENPADAYAVVEDPNVSLEQKNSYAAASVCKFALTAGKSSLDAALSGAGTIPDSFAQRLQEEIEQYRQGCMKKTAGAVQTIRFSGRQFASRGSVSHLFHVPDYGNAGLTPSAAVSSRLYADGYVEREETNYSARINGRTVASGKLPKLTQLLQTQVGAESLRAGQTNTLAYQYDTAPGSSVVNSDAVVTLLYPANTKIGYINRTTTLQQVCPLPDFAVYAEQISAEQELIAGEAAELKVQVSNLGGSGGWGTVTVSDGGVELYQSEALYLAANASETLSIPWTPQSETNAIEVRVVNSSIELEESDDKNNQAVRQFEARQRQVPQILTLEPGVVYEQSPYVLSVDATDCADVISVGMVVDGTETECQAESCEMGENRRYVVRSKQGLSIGEHKVKILMRYAVPMGTKAVAKEFTVFVTEKNIPVPVVTECPSGTLLYDDDFCFTVAGGDNLTKTELLLDGKQVMKLKQLESKEEGMSYQIAVREFGAGAHTLTIRMYYSGKNSEQILFQDQAVQVTVLTQSESHVTVETDGSVSNPVFYLADRDGCTTLSCEQTGDQEYRFAKTLNMVNHPEQYQLLVQHDRGLAVQGISGNQIKISSLNAPEVLFAKTGVAKNAQLTQVLVQKADGQPVEIALPITDRIAFSAGRYELLVKGNIGNEYFTKAVELDLTKGSQSVALDEFVLSGYYQMEATDETSWNARLYYRSGADEAWSYREFSTLYDAGTDLLKCYTADQSVLDGMQEAMMVVYSKNEVYTAPVNPASFGKSSLMDMSMKETSGSYTVLNRGDLNKVTLSCETKGLSVVSARAENGMFDLNLTGTVLYLPSAQYSLCVTVYTGSQYMPVKLEDEIGQETELVVDRALTSALTDVTISWAGQFKPAASVSSHFSDDEQISASSFTSGGTFKTEAGQQTLCLNLEQEDYGYRLEKNVNVTQAPVTLEVGSSFQGKISNLPQRACLPGTALSLSLAELTEKGGAALKAFTAYHNPMNGNVIFTDVNDDSRQFVMSATAASEGSVQTILPSEEGTYRVSVQLYSYYQEKKHQHVPVADPQKAATCTQSGRTAGSHCAQCGEILKAQTVIPALGHSYTTYIDNQDSTHTAVCGRCKNTVVQKHTIPCKLCGAVAAQHVHSWNASATVDVAPTCQKEGSKSIHCSVCNQIKEGSKVVIPKTAHKWDKGKVTKKATAIKAGERVRTCTVCKTKKTEKIAKTSLPKKGATFTDKASQAKYKVTRSDAKKGTVEYVKYTGKQTKVTIPATVKKDGVTFKVTSVGANALKGNKKVKTITVGKYVTKIGSGAFQSCRVLSRVKMGNAVTKLGTKVCYNCPKLTSVTLSTQLTVIPASAFEKCSALVTVTVPAKVTTIDKRAFYGCKKLKRVLIKTKKLKKLGTGAFQGIYKKALFKAPSAQLKKYKKLFTTKKGFKKTMKLSK